METTVYFGPTIKEIGLFHKSFFEGEFSPAINDLIAKNPGIKSLFVPLDQFAKVNHELKNPNSPTAQIYKHFSK